MNRIEKSTNKRIKKYNIEKYRRLIINSNARLVLFCFNQPEMLQKIRTYEESIDELLKESQIIFPPSNRAVSMGEPIPYIKNDKYMYQCCICGLEAKYTEDIACPYHFVLARKINELIIFVCGTLWRHIRLEKIIHNDVTPFVYEYCIQKISNVGRCTVDNDCGNFSIVIDIFNENKYVSKYIPSVTLTIKNNILVREIPKYIVAQFLNCFNENYTLCLYSKSLFETL